jgi:hypothetical protein
VEGIEVTKTPSTSWHQIHREFSFEERVEYWEEKGGGSGQGNEE